MTESLNTSHNFTDASAQKSTKLVCHYYDKWAKTYDQDTDAMEYRGPRIIADYVNTYMAGNKTGKIMDICAGTGAGAVELSKHGFFNVDALDGSQEMLNQAKEQNLYNEYYQTYLQPGVPVTKIKDNSYDCVVCIGSFLGGHLKPKVADEFCRILKNGMYCIIGMREAWLYDVPEYANVLEPYLVRYPGWRLVSRDMVPGWFADFPGVVFVFQKKNNLITA